MIFEYSVFHKPTPIPSKAPTLKLQRQRGGEFGPGRNQNCHIQLSPDQ